MNGLGVDPITKALLRALRDWRQSVEPVATVGANWLPRVMAAQENLVRAFDAWECRER